MNPELDKLDELTTDLLYGVALLDLRLIALSAMAVEMHAEITAKKLATD